MSNDNIIDLTSIDGDRDKPKPFNYTITYQGPDGINSFSAEGYVMIAGGLLMIVDDGYPPAIKFGVQISNVSNISGQEIEAEQDFLN